MPRKKRLSRTPFPAGPCSDFRFIRLRRIRYHGLTAVGLHCSGCRFTKLENSKTHAGLDRNRTVQIPRRITDVPGIVLISGWNRCHIIFVNIRGRGAPVLLHILGLPGKRKGRRDLQLDSHLFRNPDHRADTCGKPSPQRIGARYLCRVPPRCPHPKPVTPRPPLPRDAGP